MKVLAVFVFLFLSGCIVDGTNKPTVEFETVGDISLDPKNPEQFESIGLRFNVKSKW